MRLTAASRDSTHNGMGVRTACSTGGVCEMRDRNFFAPAARAIEADRTSAATSAKARAAHRCKVPALPSTMCRYKPARLHAFLDERSRGRLRLVEWIPWPLKFFE